MIYTLSSDNPRFSYALSKNPLTILESGKPFSRDLRKGKVYGWFPHARIENEEVVGTQVFRLWFKDHPAESSFAGGVLENFEYLDKTRYSSPYLPIMMIQAALSTAQKNRQEDDGEYYTSASWSMFAPDQRALENFCKHYAERTQVKTENLADKYVRITLTAGSVFEVLNLTVALCIMQAMRDDSVYVRLDEPGMMKYLNALNNAEAPYYIRYLFASRAVSSRQSFYKLRGDIEGIGMTMFYGDTRQQRFDAINYELTKPNYDNGHGVMPTTTGETTLVDIGCGELWYATRLAKTYAQVVAVDLDKELCEANERKVQHKKIDNITVINADALAFSALAIESGSLEGCDVLVTEVLEHMPENDADNLIRTLVASGARRVIATVPNKSFNDNYGLGEDFRHPDHFYEPTFEEWNDYCYTLAAELGVEAYVRPIGDIVNDQSVTTMCVFTLPSSPNEEQR